MYAKGNYTFVGNANGQITQGTSINACQGLKSLDGQYIFVIQSDGNAVIYNTITNFRIWSTNINTNNPNSSSNFIYQNDGNLVLYNNDGKNVLWSSGTNGKTSTTLMMQPNGSLVLYNGNPTIGGTGNSLSYYDNDVTGNVVWQTPSYIGCYNDAAQNGSPRSLPNSLGFGDISTTEKYASVIDECRIKAQNRGDTLFGIQAGGQCWSGSDLRRATSAGLLNPSDPKCTPLGNSWVNQIYSNIPDNNSPRSYVVEKNKDYYGNDITYWKGPHSQCSKICDTTQSCNVYTLNKENGRTEGCWLKTGIGSQLGTSTPDRESYLLLGATPPRSVKIPIPNYRDLDKLFVSLR
jgi:hypothetical protein